MKRVVSFTAIALIVVVAAPAGQTGRVLARDLGIVVGTLPPGG